MTGVNVRMPITEVNARFFMLISSFGKKVRGTYLGTEKTVERPRFVSILSLVPTPRQTQNLNIDYHRFVLPASGRKSYLTSKSIVQPSLTRPLFSYGARQALHLAGC